MKKTMPVVAGCFLLVAGICSAYLVGCSDNETRSVNPAEAALDMSATPPVVSDYRFQRAGDNLASPGHLCDHGEFLGRWIRDDIQGTSGRLHGAWVNTSGDTTGLLLATFTWNSAGYGEIRGSVNIPISQHVIAYVRGTFYYDDYRRCPLCGSSRGVVGGLLWNRFGGSIGVFCGSFGDFNLPPEQNEMPLHGRWGMFCNSTIGRYGE